MADKMTDAMKTVLDILANVASSTSSTTKRASNVNNPNDRVTKTQRRDSIRRGRSSAITRKNTSNQETTKLKQEINKPVYQNEEIKRLRCIVEERKEYQAKKNHRTEITASTSASSSNICAGNKTRISPNPTTRLKTKVEAKKPIVMTDEMKRIKMRIEQRKQLNIKKKYSSAATSATNSTYCNKNSNDNTTTSNVESLSASRKRRSTRIELKCPICTYSVVQNAAFAKHLKDNHDMDKLDNIGEYRNQECPFCGIMVEMTSYNYHIETMHPDIFEKKMKF